MIRVGVVATVFAPHEREFHTVEHRDGMTLRDLGVEHFGDGAWAPYVNGELHSDVEHPVDDGDFIHLVGFPTGLGAIFMYAIQLIAAVLILKAIILSLFPDMDQADTDRDPYLGFQNSYRPEGDAIPIIYGTLRIGHPCINQSVLGAIFQLDTTVLSQSETLNTMFAVSHGPIDGFGLKRQEISQRSDGGELFFSGENAQLQVNGIEAQHFTGVYEWRTGTGSQTPIRGSMGQIQYTDPGVIYSLNKEIPNGNTTTGYSIPYANTGEVVYSSRIRENDTTEFVTQLLSTKADRAVIQFLFQMGLYHMDSDSGNYSHNDRYVQAQYWVTDASGSAVPSTVTILEARQLANDEPNPISFDWPFELVNPTTIAGGGGRKGYAALASIVTSRMKMLGTGVAGEALDLLRPGAASSILGTTYKYADADAGLKFTFAAWVRVPSWGGGYGVGDPPVAWLWHWSREATGGPMPLWHENSTPSTSNLWCPDAVLSADDSFGCACCIAVDPSDVAANGGVDADDPWVVLMVYTWDGAEGINQSSEMGVSNGYMSRFVSKKLGRASQFASRWKHIGFSWDQSFWRADGAAGGSATGGKAQARAYVDGLPVDLELDPHIGSDIGVGGGSLGVGGLSPGYMWGMKPDSGPFDGMLHVPLKFFTGATAQLMLGGWDNISTTGTQPFQQTIVDIAEYAFVAAILPDSWFAGVMTTSDTFGNNPTGSVSTLMADDQLAPLVRLACPMNDLDVVGGGSDHYKNYKYPDATTQAGGCLQLENTASIKTTDGPTFYAQIGVSEGAYYILEVFVSSPTEDDQNDQNSISIESITTFLTEQYSYPGVAILSTSIEGTDQISGTNPKITTIVHGKKMNVWDGESIESPTFRFEWSNNPAWVALDILTNQPFGLGGIFSPEGTYEMMQLPAFFEWAAFCDEGVPDAYGLLSFFGMRTGTPQYYSLTLYFGMINTAGTSVQVMPNSWAVGKHMSITSILAAEVGTEWITKDDVVGGLNDASNLLEVTNIQFQNSGGIAGGFHGWDAWFEVTMTRNRETWLEGTSSTSSPYPNGVFGDEFPPLTSLGEAGQYEYRARFNGTLQKKNANAWDEILGIFANGRAIPMKIGRKVMPVWDRPREPVALVGQANIRAGTFELSYLDSSVVPNSMEAEILDADRNWQGQTVLVDYTGIQGTTRFQQLHKERFSLPGCTSRSQAIREATYRLNKYALCNLTAKFEVGPDSIHLLPGDRIQVAHDVPKYGTSGRLPVAMQILNTHPGGEEFFSSWTQQGGDCTISDRSLLELITHANGPPPLVNYLDGSVLAYSVPTTTFSSEGQVLAGSGLASGYERSPVWAGQHVAVGDGLYPTPDYNGAIPLAPLDRIDTATKVVNFSAYCKQPPTTAAGGASRGVALVIYRICGDTGYVNAAHGAAFMWDGSGVLEFDTYIGDNTGTSSPFGITAWAIDPASPQLPHAWHRIAITYDNDDTGPKTGAGEAGVGDYIQARLFYTWSHVDTYANQPTFYDVSDGGRGNQFLSAGDPSNLDLGPTPTTRFWQGLHVNLTLPVAGQKIVHEPDIAPPFYPQDKTLGTGTAGDRGFVIFFDQDTAVTTTPFYMSQDVDVNFSGSSSPLVTTRAAESMCFTGYFKHYFTGESFSCVINLRCGITQSGTEEYTDDGAEVALTWNGSIYTATAVAVGGTITASVTKTMVRLNDSTMDAEWLRVTVTMENSSNFNSIGFQVGSDSTSGGGARFYGWGFRLHGRDGIAAGAGDAINPYTHHGTHIWGAMYDPSYVDSGSDGEPPEFSAGAQLQLDRDVQVTGGTPAELYLRSSFERDENLNTDVTEVLVMAYNELPNIPGATITKPARSWLSFSMPQKMYPRTGDIYSFGDSGSSTEDFIVNEVRTNPETLVRRIECIQYNEAVYDDTSFAEIVDPPDEPTPGSGGGNVGDHGYGGNYNVTYEGPGFGAISIWGKASPYRAADGYLVPSWKLRWKDTARVKRMPYKEVRLFARRMPTGSFQYVATIPAGVKSYRYDDPSAEGGTGFMFFIQPVGFSGTCLPVARCPSVLVPASVYGPLPRIPKVETSVNGFHQEYSVTSGNTSRLAAIEGRIGGWIISTIAWIVDPNTGQFDSPALLPVPTNAAGVTQGVLFARGKTLGGAYGVATSITGTEAFADVKATRSVIAENGYTAAASSISGELQVDTSGTTDVLQWDPSSTSLGPVYYELTGLVASRQARRSIVNAIIAGYQIRHETLADLNFALGSSTGRNWSLEGPMKDDGGNAKVEIEWKWSSTSSAAGVAWRPFEPGEVYALVTKFRLKWTRKTKGDQVRLSRFTLVVDDVPSTTMVDGGTF